MCCMRHCHGWERLQKLSGNRQSFTSLLKSTNLEIPGSDKSCPLSYEPSGSDFLSPCIQVYIMLPSLALTHDHIIQTDCLFINIKKMFLAKRYVDVLNFDAINRKLIWWQGCWKMMRLSGVFSALILHLSSVPFMYFKIFVIASHMCSLNVFQDLWSLVLFLIFSIRVWISNFLPQMLQPGFSLEPGRVNNNMIFQYLPTIAQYDFQQ